MARLFSTLAIGFLGSALWTGCNQKASDSSGGQTNTNETASSPLTAPVDYLGAVGKAQQSAIATIDLASIKQAIQMYRTEEGKYPASLEDLVTEKYLPRLPELPSGMAYVYEPATGLVKAIKR